MLKIGLCGFGTVGSGVYEIINQNPYLKELVEIKKILVKDINKKRNVNKELLTTNYKDIVLDPEIDIVIEVIGGLSLAKNIIEEALNNKKDVITANKALLANNLNDFLKLAILNDKHIYFEASVCGAIPVIDTILDINKTDEITKIEGIINGSTNYILTKTFSNLTFKEALDLAYQNGFLESDPTDDLKGYDALRKIIILSKLAYKASFDNKHIKSYPMDNLSNDLINYLTKKNYIIKYVAESFISNKNLEISVMPKACLKDTKLANVLNEMNFVSLDCKYSYQVCISGYGAGMYPTASAIMIDLNKILNGEEYNLDFSNRLEIKEIKKHSYIIDSIEEIDNQYIIEKDNNIYITKPISIDKLDELLLNAKCFVKLD